MKFGRMSAASTAFILFQCVLVSHCFNILAVFPHEGKSHQWIFGPIVRELVRRGHTVTTIVHYKFNIQSPGSKEIIINDPDSRGKEVFTMDGFQGSSLWYQKMRSANNVLKAGLKSCEHLFSNNEVQELLRSSQKFDLIFGELFNSDCVQGFVHKYKAPLVAISSTIMIPWHNARFGNPDNPSYIPNNHLWYHSHMDFSQRILNFITNTYSIMMYESYTNLNKELLEKHLNEDLGDFGKIVRNTSLIFVNSHWTLALPRPYVPSVVEIGGVHVPKVKKLPQNIEKFINESTHGVIYFSLGSMIKGHTFPQEKRDAFLKAFARLPQRVLWKWENETLPGKPDNVMIQKWMPQFDILSHPNVKAFISHGGLLGTTESVHCGVPMLVMPQYGDQHTNAKAIEANGGGVILYLKEATEDTVYQSLKKILDPGFRAKAKALSDRFRDRPMSPMDTAIYWVEYVARHKGAPHMRTAAVDMPLYQYLLLDVLAFLGAIVLLFFYITYKLIRLVLRSVLSKKKIKQN